MTATLATFSEGGTLNTSNATEQTLWSKDLTGDEPVQGGLENCAMTAVFRASARRLSDNAVKHWTGSVGFKRGTGNADASQPVDLNAFGEGADLTNLLLAALSFDATGSTIRARATGLAATNIE